MQGNFAGIAVRAPRPIVLRMRALAWAIGWLLGYYLLAQYGVFLLPEATLRTTTLAEYLAMVQIVSILLGVSALLLATRSDHELRGKFFPELSGGHVFRTTHALLPLLLGPATFLAAYGLGMYLAFDTLLEELASRGARAVQAQTGELGRTARVDTLLAIIPFTVILAPLGEELLFRGGLYGGIQDFVDSVKSKVQPTDAPPPSVAVAGLPQKVPFAATSFGSWLFRGGFAVLASSLCFGLMHADTAGGMGIVRVVSASLLGFCCGVLRSTSRSLVAPLALHAAYNLLSLATLRGWLVFQDYPTKYTIPTVLGPLSLVGLTLALGVYFGAKRRFAKVQS